MAPSKNPHDTERIPLSAIVDTEELPALGTDELPALITRAMRGLVPSCPCESANVPPPVHAPLRHLNVGSKPIMTQQHGVPVPVRAVPGVPVRAILVSRP